MNPLVTIIIPIFNRAEIICETLDSVLAQTYNNWECVLVDDGSTDATLEVIENYQKADKRFQWFNRPERMRKGPSSCRNYGLKQAIGEYVIFLDSDDLLANFCLEKRIDFTKNNSEFDFWIFKMKTFKEISTDHDLIFNQMNFKNKNENDYYYELFLEGKNPFAITCPLWKRKTLEDLNGFDENLRMLEDPDLHLRAYKEQLKSKTAVQLEVDCYYRIPENSQEKALLYDAIAAKSNYYFLKKHYVKNNESVKKNYKRLINMFAFSKPSLKILIQMLYLGKRYKTIKTKHIFFGILIYMFSLSNL